MRSHTPGQDRPTETLSIEQTGALEFSIMISISAIRHCLLGAAVLAGATVLHAQISPLTPDIPPRFEVPTESYDYVKRDVMIPMRDGVKLHTVIVVPKGAKSAPMLLTRTPYNASARAERNRSPHMVAALPLFDELFAADGYIRIYQDVRGKYG